MHILINQGCHPVGYADDILDIVQMLQKAFGHLTMSQKNFYKWYKDFKEGKGRVDDLERPGRPSTSTDEQHVNQIK